MAVRSSDLPALLALNNAHAAELSLLDADGFARLIASAAHARQSADASAFVVAFDERADYGSVNYLWFKTRYERFLYVDRAVVAPSARGRELAHALYDTVFAVADSLQSGPVVCEINVEPPNLASQRFHEACGFRAVGGAALPGGRKMVAYYEHTRSRMADRRPES
ncbi:GNAT family N-acetyltransferase [Jiella sp. MQZ9-1]|uniref:GNAT family N-acetyltransferase n=1 Tax=Jiella flava TaxID=2816857 RepID=UPI001E5E179F|nr:GNAT family N-acetyltransferase [Jiella flava]